MGRPDPERDTLYRRLGGHEAIASVVDTLTRRLAGDGELAHYFARLDLEALRRHQVAFLDAALGGPHPAREGALLEAHRGLGITARDFGLAHGHLAAALRACAVPEGLSAEVLARVAAWHGEVAEVDH
jgi:hemoglobin